MSDAEADDAVIDISLQDVVIKTCFGDNIKKWTQNPFFVNEALLPELNRVGVDAMANHSSSDSILTLRHL